MSVFVIIFIAALLIAAGFIILSIWKKSGRIRQAVENALKAMHK